LLWLPLCTEVDVEWGDGEAEGEGKSMMVSKALGWLCEEPEHSFTLNKIFWARLARTRQFLFIAQAA